MKKIISSLLIFLSLSTMGSNIQVSNISYSNQMVTFTISWDNSWNTSVNTNSLYPSNWDAAWVFIKYQSNIDNLWKHAMISTTGADHSISGSILEVNPTGDSTGVFIRRSNPGSGSVEATVTLKTGALLGASPFNIKVFATEMVYIPQGNFQLGDGNVSGASYFTASTINAGTQSTGISAGQLFSGSPFISSNYPMGYQAYYMMKYEITNEQWVDFLNCLTYDQQSTKIDVAPNAAANTQIITATNNSLSDNIIKIRVPGLNNTMPAEMGCDLDGDNVYNENNDGQNIAAAYIGKRELYAYLDWSGLRPMTELEFEKACRGTQNRIAGEYAWGSTAINVRTRANLTNLGQANETYTGAVASGQIIAAGGLSANSGPARVGIFATSTSGRSSSGSGFYGNMDLSGNLWELCVHIDASAAGYTGLHGNGTLDPVGDADVSNWPSNTGANGTTIRGGSFAEQTSYTAYTSTSWRLGVYAAPRSVSVGGRGVRTSP
jgi:formylglycine-generating enzyme required for sulfatase activity